MPDPATSPRTNTWLLALAVGLVGGVIIGALPRWLADEDLALGVAAPGPTAGAMRPRSPDRAPEPAPDRATGSDILAGLVSLAQTEATRTLAGSGIIRGRVVTARGEPVSDVAIVASLELEPDPTRRSETLAERIRALIDRETRRAGSRRSTVTDARGEFAIEGLPDGLFRVDAEDPRMDLLVAKGSRNWNLSPGSWVTFLTHEVVTVPCRVLLPDGTAAARATFKRTDRRTPIERHEWSSDDGALRLPPGSYEFVVNAGDDAFSSDPVPVEVVTGAAPAPLVVRLLPQIGIKGRIVFTELQSADVMVLYTMRYEGEPPTEDELVRHGKQKRSSAYYGFEFTLEGLQPGIHAIAAGPPGSRVNVIEHVMVTDHLVRRDLVVPRLERDHHVIVWARGPDGALLDDVTITGCALDHRGNPFRASTRREDGSHWLRVPDAANSSPHYTLSVASPRYGVRETECRTPAEIEVHFEDPASLVVTFVGGSPPIERMRVFLTPHDPVAAPRHDLSEGREGTLDADGVCRFAPLQTGSYALTVRLRSSARSFVEVLRREVEVHAAEERLEVVFPALFRLEVSVDREHDAEPAVDLVSLGWERDAKAIRGRPTTGGRFVFDDLRAGRYLVVCGDRVRHVDVAADGRLDMGGSYDEGLLAMPTGPDGFLARVGFEAGDLITGAADEDEPDVETLRELRTRIQEGQAVFVRVRRAGGAALSFRIPERDTYGERVLGGTVSLVRF